MKEDKTTRALEEMRRWKEQKRRGKIILHYDGSGDIAKIEVSLFVK
jgi:hypothetical protein